MTAEVKPNMRASGEPRLAKNYRLIYDILRQQGAGKHLAVADVYALARRENVGIGETTVYRALARLRDLGLVSEIAVPGADNAYYEVAASPHSHFRCDDCGSVEDVDYVLSPRIVAELARKQGAEITEVLLSLHGLCASCKDRGA
jgi:Fe2+ or Zn2+ uptake regulation protein